MATLLVGKSISVIKAENESYLFVTGTVIDETKNTIIIDDGQKAKTILKKGCVFSIDGQNIDGEKLTKRIEDRLKKRRKK